MELWLAVTFALAFALTNGFHDAANAIATLVATRGAGPVRRSRCRPSFNLLGALLVGTAVADTIAGIVTVGLADAVAVIGAGVLAAVLWNLLTWWRGLPSSSGHALVGGLVGAALAADGLDAVHWGGLDGWKPVGVFGVLIALAVSPVLGLAFGGAAIRLSRRALRRATLRVRRPIDWAQWAMSAGLSFSHGANDAQKSMGIVGALLVAGGRLETFAVPFWAMLACGARTDGRNVARRLADRADDRPPHLPARTGGRVREPGRLHRRHLRRLPRGRAGVHHPGRRLVGDRRGRRPAALAHVRWTVVGSMAFAWLLTLPATAALGAAAFVVWMGIA